LGNQLLLYFRHIALAEPGKFGQFAYGPVSGIFRSGEREGQLRDGRTDARIFGLGCRLFRPERRLDAAGAKRQLDRLRLGLVFIHQPAGKRVAEIFVWRR
jgi:hypothetical protein